MKQFAKRGFALFVAFVLVISLMPTFHHHTAHAAGTEVEYVYSENYIYNWGTRGTLATFLSPNAEAFYTGDYVYETLSGLAGGTSTSTAPGSALYNALQTLMRSRQTYETSYEATKTLFQYTDCEGSALTSNKISSFYSGTPIGPSWDGAWNREHTWPNSKGDASGNGENDIMMLRPTSSVENSARGNKAYGESSSFYHPNSESNGQYDLRGDVARIMLYVYVRWGNTGSMWGSDGVMESLDVLLNWMEADPVDTWELGRNDSVESITGTRNVFVDYPEFAFLLFGAEIPEDMKTPSGEAEASNGCHHDYVAGETVAATCTTSGYTVYTCSLCSKSTNRDIVPATGHSYSGGQCTVCGEAGYEFGVIEAPVAGTAYKFGMIQEKVSATDVHYLTGAMDGYYMATTTNKETAADVYLEATTGGYYLYTMLDGVKTYINMVVSGTYVNGAYEATASTVYIYDVTSKTLIASVDGVSYWFGTRNDKTYTTAGPCKVADNGFYCQFYGDIIDDAAPGCEHANTTIDGAVDATCTEDGYTGITVCTDCGQTIGAGQKIPALGHNYENSACTRCGEEEPAVQEFTLSFADKAQRTVYTTTQQVWEQNGITFTNDKASSTTNVADYANPVRLYAKSKITVNCANMTKIVFTCNSSSYATALQSSIGGAASVSGSTVTVELTQTQDSFVVESLTAQIRLNSITVTVSAAAAACEHTNTTVEGAVAATCTTAGHTGKTVCTDCGATVSAGEVIPATGHSYENGTCTGCGEAEPQAGDAVTVTVSIGDHATANGWTNGTKYTELKMDNTVTVTVSGGSNTGKYYTSGNEWRIYQTESPSIVISAGDMTIVSVKITYNINNNGVLTLDGSNITSGTTVDVNATSITFGVGNTGTATNGQVKITAIEVVYGGNAEPELPCEHTNTTIEGAVEATCTTEGHTGATVCTDCGETVSEGEVIPALGHNYVDGVCTRCGAAEPTCQHTNTTVQDAVEATCTTEGHTGKTVCSDCSETVSEGEVIPALGHNYVDGVCTRCGAAEPVFYEHTIDLTTKDNRTVYTNEQQVWKQNGITVTNDKAASTNNVGDYAPARFYKSSKLTIEHPGMTKIVFNCNSYKDTYAADLVTSIGTRDGVTVTVDGLTVTVEFAAACNSFVIEQLAGQVRVDSITVTSNTAPCQHTNTTVVDAVEATCTTEGHTGKTVCADCGKLISEGEVIGALGHNYVDGICTRCGAAEPTCKHTNTTVQDAIEATCTTEGHTGKTVCSDCSETVSEGDVIPALGHNYVDGKCTRCGEIEVIFGVIETPVAGTAYKFGMIQKNKSETDVYYLTGAMSGYYMDTTTDKDTAIDVYLEETTGGYYLYTMLDGVKTYINMVVSGTHVNGAYETTASTVYTYNEESKTIVAQVNDSTYWFGTRNDKTYTTVGPVDVSYNGFYCQFYGEITQDVVLNGIHKDEDGTWRYYVDGVVMDYTGLVEHTDGKTYYVYRGVVPMDYVGLYAHSDGKIYYIYYGVAVTDYTGLYAHTNGTVYYIDRGTVSTTYTGLYAHTDGNTYYVYQGVIPTSYIGLCYHTDGKTYYIYKGVAVESYTGLYNHTDGKVYYVNQGVIDPTFVGLYTHTTGATYYVYSGVVLTSYVGLYLHTDGYVYYVYTGVLVPTYVGFYYHSDGNLYYMSEGVIATGYTGLAQHSDGKLYYVVSGVFDATFNGTVTFEGNEYEVVNGIAQP